MGRAAQTSTFRELGVVNMKCVSSCNLYMIINGDIIGYNSTHIQFKFSLQSADRVGKNREFVRDVLRNSY